MRLTAEGYEELALAELDEAKKASIMDQLKHVGRAQTLATLALVAATMNQYDDKKENNGSSSV